MIKLIFIFASLFVITLSDEDMFIPMDKDSKYGDDVCKYRDKDGYYHVKPCEKGKYCVDNFDQRDPGTSYLEICQDIPEIKALSNLKDKKCSTSFECENDFTCEGSSCSYSCPTGQFFYKDNTGFHCDLIANQGSGYCESKTIETNGAVTVKYSSPEDYKICGKLTIAPSPSTTDVGIYYKKLNEYDYIGTVQDGEYVEVMELCESGFALYFYYDGKFDNPKVSSTAGRDNEMYLRCVTPLAVNKIGSCSINYKIKDEEPLNYNVDRVPSAYQSEMRDLCDDFPYYQHIKIMSEKFREYSKSISEEERKTCGDLEGINKYTCENNGLIKSWFAYKYPEIYIHYNDRKHLEKVFAYLIQKKYPSYSFGQFLNLSLLSLLFLI